MLDASTEIINKRFSEVAQGDEFLQLEFAGVVDCICGRSDVHGDIIAEAAFGWIKQDRDSRIKMIRDLFSHIQLEQCSAQFLKSAIVTYKDLLSSSDLIFQLTEALAVIATTRQYLTAPGTGIKAGDQITSAGAQIARALPLGKTLAVLGGFNPKTGECNQDCWLLDEQGNYKLFNQLPSGLSSATSSIFPTPEGFGVTGGKDGKLCSMFSVLTKIWSDLPFMPRARKIHASVYHTGGIYVVACGDDVSNYNPKNGTWNELSKFPGYLRIPKVTCLHDKMYVFDDSNSKDVYVHQKNTWKKCADLPEECACTCVIGVHDSMFVVGGPKKLCYCYNPVHNAWEKKNGPPLISQAGSAIYSCDHLYLFAGSVWDEITTVQEYNMEMDKWRVTELKMPAALREHKVLLLDL